jgi:hypothetical protein
LAFSKFKTGKCQRPRSWPIFEIQFFRVIYIPTVCYDTIATLWPPGTWHMKQNNIGEWQIKRLAKFVHE